MLLTTAVAGAALAADAPESPPGRLAYWNFDAPRFATGEGYEPEHPPALPEQAGYDGPAPFFASTNPPTPLTWRVATPGGRLLLGAAGGLRFLYRPAWSSRSPQNLPGYGWGRGPADWARLLEITDARDGRPVLAISADPAGTNLVVQARDRRGLWRTNCRATINWVLMQPELRPRDAPLPWHEIAFNYSATNTVLVVNGAHARDLDTGAFAGPGVDLGRLPELRLTLGSDAVGRFPAAGVLDEIETYDRPVAPTDLYHNRQETALHATVDLSPPTVRLRWYDLSGGTVSVRRREAPAGEWVTLDPRRDRPWFVDADPALAVGRTYEYEVGRRAIFVSLAGAPVFRRGRVLLLVEQSVAPRLTAELEQLRRDLIGDGWTPVQHRVPRHDYNAWARQAINRDYRDHLRRIKGLILREQAAAPDETRAVFLIGHVTIPYSGVATEDGHFEMAGAWPADAWYGDVDGEWSDTVMNTTTNLTNPIRRNVPGDGKFDPATFREYITTPGGAHGVELAVGRIDFARLPAFKRRGEADLLRDYLRKAHRYRHRQLRFGDDLRAGSFFYTPFSPVGRSLNLNALLLASRGPGLHRLSHGDAFLTGAPYLWALQGGYGGHDTLHNSRQAAADQGIVPVTTAALAAGEITPRVAFYVLKGSYFGDWNNYQDDLLKALLALPDSGLAAFWTYDTVWRFEPLGVGAPLGEGFVRTARGGASTRTTFQLGDPTLRTILTAPPGAAAAHRSGRAVELTWGASPDADAGYFVLRTTRGWDGPFELLNPQPVTGTRYTDASAPAGRLVYQVRAAQRVVTGSGVFTNLSQAAFAPLE